MSVPVVYSVLLLLPYPFFFLGAGLQHQGIFRVSGSQLEVNDIKNSFERGKDVGLTIISTHCYLQLHLINYQIQMLGTLRKNQPAL